MTRAITVEGQAASYLTPFSCSLVSSLPTPQWFDVERIRRGHKSCPKCTGSVVARKLPSRGLTNRSLHGRGGGLVHGRWTTAKPTHLSPSPQVSPTPRPVTSPLHLAPVVLIPPPFICTHTTKLFQLFLQINGICCGGAEHRKWGPKQI